MLELLDDYDGSAAAQRRLEDGIDEATRAALVSKGRGDQELVARAEADVQADPGRCIRMNDAGEATVYAAGRSFRGGRFETPPLCELRARALAARARAGRPRAGLRLWVLDGASPVTDIGALQAAAAPGSLFQVASQFNCLESPGAFVTEVASYFHDPTQGPRASISAFPGTLVRHYAAPAPEGGRFVQATDGRQVELLADVAEPAVAAVRNGYLRAPDITDPAALARALEDRFDAVRIGVHDGIEVVLGHDWGGAVEGAPHRTIAQVLTSTIAAGMYGGLDEQDRAFLGICRQLQRAAYLGTLLAAAALGKERVALTLIGGGVFANPIEIIWEAILWAADQARALLHRELVVVVNGRNLGEQLPPHRLRAAAMERGGGLVRLAPHGGVAIEA
ncbi:MAG TPA: hypothetical protein VNO30_12335 [Kofleriaceae bacterium]|nr:hypothetical protein [Kofleriaceae bacterium]